MGFFLKKGNKKIDTTAVTIVNQKEMLLYGSKSPTMGIRWSFASSDQHRLNNENISKKGFFIPRIFSHFH
jgi:predicted secreted protein